MKRPDKTLLRALRDNNLENALRALQAGANPNLTNKDGEAPLHYAAQHKNVHLTKALLAAGANPNSKSKIGFTPLYYARSFAVCRALLKAGAQVNVLAQYAGSPLHEAATIGPLSVTKACFELGPIRILKTPMGEPLCSTRLLAVTYM